MSYHHLTPEERKKLFRMWRNKESIRRMAAALVSAAQKVCKTFSCNVKKECISTPVPLEEHYTENDIRKH
ncbi:Helix-turn-helix domain-containing protein [Papillibacter cinnamivorans DSM 12816]|uniref:Helix-turn-helix domain-containing protein n=1 Tax=Papillibacter cinnamivorans DSM 12816 TaxID=1122930 RepID=A0A1W2C9S2_9FIRM|nr:Helix-turn-helix domain-containing protein [Papillibacter cinnamivorans DSM 12816]